ncbi:dihydropteroate synthase [Congregibacter brevis]|uniref:Dihydropteroate synthase n=2 Tax=Congregibacter brevis TaxID=3081201 RepID=A0ABZ0IG67_9GAMM|nr:dihydropteroate synthase [Congregibacter sp. IMCC45268]
MTAFEGAGKGAGATLSCAGTVLDLSSPIVMGVLNVTPDSFSDGGLWMADGRPDLDALRREATAMVDAGARILDIGGESTRPGAVAVSEQQELDRVLPVFEALRAETDAVLSLDSSTPAVMRAAASAGAGLLNDVRALQRDGALDTAAKLGLPVCLMHMQGAPETMQNAPAYRDVVREVTEFLQDRANACISAGLAQSQIVVDPGFGFGKTLEHNLVLLAQLTRLRSLGFPIVAGLSRKSLIAKLTGRELESRLPGSLALAMLAAQHGAVILRVHDVAETTDVLRILQAVKDVHTP